ncbi:MAG: cyanophycinase [Clostridiaceae bacterium]
MEGGSLILIGGAEDKLGKKDILKKVALDSSKEGKILVVTAASSLNNEAGEVYRDIFKDFGIKDINILNVEKRGDGFLKDNIDKVLNSNIVFFTGGDQLRITSLLGGTPLYKSFKEAYKRGSAFVGTSAGASVMSDTMIVSGPDSESPRKCTVKMAPGLGLINGVIVDQHFAQRGRIGRLLTAVSENPEIIGIGIDENTALCINKEGIARVIGDGAVYFVDGKNISYTNVSELHQDDVLSIFNIRMHVLIKDNKFNLKQRIAYLDQEGINEDKKTKDI